MARTWPEGPYKTEGNLMYTPDGERLAALFDHLALVDLFANAPGLEAFARLHVKQVAEALRAAPERKWAPRTLYVAGGFAVVLARIHGHDEMFGTLIKTFQSCEPDSPFLVPHATKLISTMASLL